MKQTAAMISTYAADISGICSAMYELGGMTVMHDASGCNSTYNTHDEPRWYDMDSLVFISALSETEAILGDDDKLIHDTVSAARDLQPEFITIGGTPIPMMIGTDFRAVAREVEHKTGIPSFGLNTDGMHSYVSGVSKALCVLAEKICEDHIPKTEELSINILGATPLDFSINGTILAMEKALEQHGIRVHAIWAMNENLYPWNDTDKHEDSQSKMSQSLQDAGEPFESNLFYKIRTASCAHVNLVISAGGLEAAKIMEKRFQIPYVIGTPCGKKFTEKIADGIKEAAKTGKSKNLLKHYPDAKIVIIGESINALSLANALEEENGTGAKVLCAVEASEELFSEGCLEARDEAELIPHLEQADLVIADPMYRPICPKTARFIDLPHEAFSGRIYRKQMWNMMNEFEQFAARI